mmetsp:Transcript_160183/g.282539  ORF Transcript_160183/g.282539 Transcript_160183/m.282539 type:complete len:425 (+) Transcript_160183:56-1330(+)
MSSSTTYGTEAALAEAGRLPSTRCAILGHDGPVLLLTWFLVMGLFIPLMLVRNIVIPIIGGALCFTQALLMASHMGKTSTSYWWYNVHSFLVFAGALVVGGLLRPVFIEHLAFDGRTLGKAPYATYACCLTVVCISLLYIIAISWILPRFGVKFIGSSGKIADGEKGIWRPEKAAVMDFGCAKDDLTDGSWLTDDSESYAPRLSKNLLSGDCFWSGEFIFDYAFHAANEHIFLGCLFCHPAHPFEKWERLYVLATVCLLIVFPVAAFSVVLSAGILRTVVQAILITAPRNLIKGFLMNAATKQEAAILAHHRQITKGPLTLTEQEKMLLEQGDRELLKIYATTAAVTLMIVLASCYVIRMSGATVGQTLTDNMDGMMFCFYLDLVFDLVMPHDAKDGVRCWGFIMRWRHEVGEYKDAKGIARKF